MNGVDAVVLAVRHQAYMKLSPEEILKMSGRSQAVIDCFGIIDDPKIRKFFEPGCEVKGLERGHTQRIKEEVRRR